MNIVQTGKAEYDSSKEEDKQQQFATGSIFQGLRADIDGCVYCESLRAVGY